MKLTTIISALLTLYSMACYANESNAKNNINNSAPNHYFATNSSPTNQLIFVHDLIITSIDSSPIIEIPAQISGSFNSQFISIELGLIQSEQQSNWSKYYFQGALTLHKHDNFNLSLMANIEQLNNFHSLYLANNKDPIFLVENLTKNEESELKYSYGLIGSYSVNPTWQFSGGIIHTQALDEPNSNTWSINSNMALIGTSYSF